MIASLPETRLTLFLVKNWLENDGEFSPFSKSSFTRSTTLAPNKKEVADATANATEVKVFKFNIVAIFLQIEYYRSY